MAVCHACLGVFLAPRLRARSSSWGRRCVLCVCVCIGARLSCGEWALALALTFCFQRLCLSFVRFLTRCSVVPDGNDTNNQPTQGPRHYDTLTTKNFYGILLRVNLKDNAAALPVREEVAEG